MRKIGLAGYGEAGRRFASAIRLLPETELAAVWMPDRETDAADEQAAASLAQQCRDIEELLGAGIDAICIAVPLAQRAETIRAAAAAGKPILCEAPIAASVAEAGELADVCRNAGSALYPVHAARSSAHYKDLRKHLKAGSIGEAGVAHFGSRLPAASGSLEAGAFEALFRDADLIRWMLGDSARVYAMQAGESGEQCTIATFRLQQGSIATVKIHSGKLHAGKRRSGAAETIIEIAGKGGVIRHDSRRTNSFVLENSDSPQGAPADPIFERTVVDGYREQLNRIRSSIINKSDIKEEEPPITLEDSFRSLAAAEAAHQSIHSGLPVIMS
jgi:predicted dehydrogenase